MRVVAVLGVVVGLLTVRDAAAQRLGECVALYDAGRHREAAGCFRPLALAGDAAAQNWLSLLHVRGHGVGHDSTAAAAWTRKTAVDAGWSGCPQEIF